MHTTLLPAPNTAHVQYAPTGQLEQLGGAPSEQLLDVASFRHTLGTGGSSPQYCVTNMPCDATGQSGGQEMVPGRSSSSS